MTTRKKLTIGLFGFGVVGEGIFNVLEKTPSLQAKIKRICIKDGNKKRTPPAELFTTNADDLLEDESIDVIVELIDDADAAYTIVTKAFSKGKSVISANKKLIAWHLDELIQLQRQNNVSFLYEAAVCGSIPIIRNLEEYYDNDLLSSFSGIVNGSTNFILSKMKQEKVSFQEALELAQQLGFAESNPALDVEGKDAVNKLTLILKHAYGISTRPDQLLHKGLQQLCESDFEFAEEQGFTIKLIAQAKCIAYDKIAASVLPTFVSNENQLFHVHNEYNGVLLGSTLADEQFLYGKGAGRYPTSSAVLSDISALGYDYQYEYKKSIFGTKYSLLADAILNIFVSYDTSISIDETSFLSIESKCLNRNRIQLSGKIRQSNLQKATWFYNERVSIISFGENAIPFTQLKQEVLELAE